MELSQVRIQATDLVSPAMGDAIRIIEEIKPIAQLAQSLYEMTVEALFDPANENRLMSELDASVRAAWQERHAAEIAGCETEAYRAAEAVMRWLAAGRAGRP